MRSRFAGGLSDTSWDGSLLGCGRGSLLWFSVGFLREPLLRNLGRFTFCHVHYPQPHLKKTLRPEDAMVAVVGYLPPAIPDFFVGSF